MYPDTVGNCAVNEYEPVGVPPTFAMSKVATAAPDASELTVRLRTERSAGRAGAG